MPLGVEIAFIECVKKATKTLVKKKQIKCRIEVRAGEQQDDMGPSAILHKHHTVPWMDAIFQTCRKQVYTPGTVNKQKMKDNNALELSSVLVGERLSLFESVYAMRNNIFHVFKRHFWRQNAP